MSGVGTKLAFFSVGVDSPFKELAEQNRSVLDKSFMSAGTMSPAETLMMSPTTTSLVGISWSLPSRRTLVVTETIFKRDWTALEVRTFWMKDVIPETRTMTTMMITVLRFFSLWGTKM